MSNIGVLQEQGDLGLGFNPITNSDELKKVHEEMEKDRMLQPDDGREKKD